MRLKNQKGVTLSEYAIIIAILIGVIVVGYGLLGRQIVDILNSHTNMFRNANENIDKNMTIVSTGNGVTSGGGSLGGAPGAPVSNCTGGSCDIDFGDFLIKGVPDNLGAEVVSNGTGGGSKALASVFANLAADIRQTNPDAADDLEEMADLISFMGDVQNKYEEIADGCASYNRTGEPPGGTTVGHCLSYSRYDDPLGVPLPSSLSTILTNYDPNMTVIQGEGMNDIGRAKYGQTQWPASFDTMAKSDPAYALVSRFKDFYESTDPKYTDTLKSVVKELYVNVNDVAFQQEGALNSAFGNDGSPLFSYKYDPVTGAKPATVVQFRTTPLTDPVATNYKDIDTAIKCIGGGSGC